VKEQTRRRRGLLGSIFEAKIFAKYQLPSTCVPLREIEPAYPGLMARSKSEIDQGCASSKSPQADCAKSVFICARLWQTAFPFA